MATAATLAGLQSSAGQAPFARILGANDAIRLAVVGIGSNVKIGGKGKQDIKEWRLSVNLGDESNLCQNPDAQQLKAGSAIHLSFDCF